MSWNKNTSNHSHIPLTMNILNGLGVLYKLTEIGEVKGLGLNDTYFGDEEYKKYKLFKLEYDNKILLDRMHRTYDCDCDDIIFTHEFTIDTEPKEWHLEVYEDYKDFVDFQDEDENGCLINPKESSYYGKVIYRKK